MKPFRLGMVGLGLVSGAHAKGYETHPLVQIVAVCDLDEPIAEVYAVTSRDHGGPKRQGAAHDPYTAPGVDIPNHHLEIPGSRQAGCVGARRTVEREI